MSEIGFAQELECTIALYEELIGHAAGRTRQMIERQGAVAALSRLMISGDEQKGFKVLRDRNLLDRSFESLVVRFANLFTRDVVTAAEWRLANPHSLL
jgi:hypothetical protein